MVNHSATLKEWKLKLNIMVESKLTKIEQTREIIQKKSKDILEILKGVTYEQSKMIIEVVSDEIKNTISKTTL